MTDAMTVPVLEVDDLSVTFETGDGPLVAVEHFSFAVEQGQTLGLVGESGSGKSATAMALMGLLPRVAKVSGSVRLHGQDLLGRSESAWREVRGKDIAIVFQDALSALNPVVRVGAQLAEAIRVHDRSASRESLRLRAIELLDLVGIPTPAQRADLFPHEFSGGMRQRVLIAMSIANEPSVLIADEPTTALDVTVQAQVLEVLANVQEQLGAAIILITHDLGVVAGVADKVVVMYAGDKVEEAPVDALFHQTAHPYTQGLLASLPRVDKRQDRGTRLYRIPGQLPSAHDRPTGCVFHPRCPHAREGICTDRRPGLVTVGAEHVAACARLDDLRTLT